MNKGDSSMKKKFWIGLVVLIVLIAGLYEAYDNIFPKAAPIRQIKVSEINRIYIYDNRENEIGMVDSEIEEIIAREKKSFTASVCDSVCPNAPYLVKVAFCSVILNRCKNTSFPNTPAEVIMLDPAFVTALDRDYSEEPSSLSLMAYDDALSGFSPCPEALYYSTTETDDFAIKTRQTLFQIGKYIFS